MALVGILTAIDAIKSSLTSQFTMMGANSFTISSRGMNIQVGNEKQRIRNHTLISYHEAIQFKEMFTEPAWVSVSFNATRYVNCEIRNGGNKSQCQSDRG